MFRARNLTLWFPAVVVGASVWWNYTNKKITPVQSKPVFSNYKPIDWPDPLKFYRQTHQYTFADFEKIYRAVPKLAYHLLLILQKIRGTNIMVPEDLERAIEFIKIELENKNIPNDNSPNNNTTCSCTKYCSTGMASNSSETGDAPSNTGTADQTTTCP